MDHLLPGQQDSVVHRQVMKSMQKLTFYLDHLTSPELMENCLIWKHQKGIKRLISLAVQGDRFLLRQSKSLNKIRATQTTQSKKKRITKNRKPPQKQQKIRYRQIIREDNENQVNQQNINTDKAKVDKIENKNIKLPHKLIITQIKKQQKIKYETYPAQKSLIIKKETDLSIDDKAIKQEDSIFYSDQSQEDIKLKEQIQAMKMDIKPTKRYMRGPYKNYTREMKQQMVDLYKSNTYSISRISADYGVPIKNIKRWAENGVDRKQGAGRKRLDPKMEDQLYNQIRTKYQPNTTIDYEQIRVLALKLTRIKDFKASKGWVISFFQRYGLNKIYSIH